MAKLLMIAGALVGATIASGAQACSVIVDHEPDYFEQKAEAKRTLSFATLVVDGEVVEAETAEHPAKVRVARVLRGSVGEYVLVREGNSCDLHFTDVGLRWRFVLQGGPEIYTTWVNYSNARAIDRLLGSDRRKDWPLFIPARTKR